MLLPSSITRQGRTVEQTSADKYRLLLLTCHLVSKSHHPPSSLVANGLLYSSEPVGQGNPGLLGQSASRAGLTGLTVHHHQQEQRD